MENIDNPVEVRVLRQTHFSADMSGISKAGRVGIS